MNALILLVIFGILTYLAVATFRSYVANRDEPDDLSEDMEPWTCPECGFAVQAGLVCIYCQTPKPGQTGHH